MAIGKLITKFGNYFWGCLVQISINNSVFWGPYLSLHLPGRISIVYSLRLGWEPSRKEGWEVGMGVTWEQSLKSWIHGLSLSKSQVDEKKEDKRCLQRNSLDDVKCNSREVLLLYYPKQISVNILYALLDLNFSMLS